jgi:hypothetical protein
MSSSLHKIVISERKNNSKLKTTKITNLNFNRENLLLMQQKSQPITSLINKTLIDNVDNEDSNNKTNILNYMERKVSLKNY